MPTPVWPARLTARWRSQPPPRTTLWPAVAALLAATWFRAQPLLLNRFHPDEALYAWFARLIANFRDVLLSGLTVDKPPLAFYLGAASMALVGNHELAARLPAFFASLLSVALVFALGRRLYGAGAAHLAAWLLALSPFAILFAVTVFIDPVLTAFLLWGLWMAAAGRSRWAGVAFTLAFATKQPAAVFVPLALAFGLLRLPSQATFLTAAAKAWALARWILPGLACVVALTFAWDAVRHAPIGVWDQGVSDNAPNRLIRSGEVQARGQAWLDLLSFATATPALNLIFVMGLPLLLMADLWRPTRAGLADYLLTGFLIGYLALYWLMAFNVWDRYLVPLVPLLALLLARLLMWAADGLRRLSVRLEPRSVTAARWLLPVLACALLAPSTQTAGRAGYPVGGDHGAYAGIDEAARFINTLPYKTVVYDFWLSWEWNYYLFDSKAYVAWMPSPAALATDLRSFGNQSPRYVVIPSWEAEAEVRAAAASAGYTLTTAHESFRPDGSRSFVVYRIEPAPAH